jgi:GTP1/Obg family GTP-binding protein
MTSTLPKRFRLATPEPQENLIKKAREAFSLPVSRVCAKIELLQAASRELENMRISKSWRAAKDSCRAIQV